MKMRTWIILGVLGVVGVLAIPLLAQSYVSPYGMLGGAYFGGNRSTTGQPITIERAESIARQFLTRSGYAGLTLDEIQGPKRALDRVQAVAQVEGSFMNALRLRGLVPIDSLNPLAGNLHRVYGVGVTALIDFQL